MANRIAALLTCVLLAASIGCATSGKVGEKVVGKAAEVVDVIDGAVDDAIGVLDMISVVVDLVKGAGDLRCVLLPCEEDAPEG